MDVFANEELQTAAITHRLKNAFLVLIDVMHDPLKLEEQFVASTSAVTRLYFLRSTTFIKMFPLISLFEGVLYKDLKPSDKLFTAHIL